LLFSVLLWDEHDLLRNPKVLSPSVSRYIYFPICMSISTGTRLFEYSI